MFDDPIRQIGDKAGARIVIPFARDREAVEEVVGRVLVLSERDDKREKLDEKTLGYLGVHWTAFVRPELLRESEADLQGLEAEVQLHTMVENAWAAAAHDLLYKATLQVPPTLARRLVRLVALAEIFDDEVERFQGETAEQPGFREMSLLPGLERELHRFTHRSSDAGLSALILPDVAALYDRPLSAVLQDVVQPWVAGHETELRDLYARYNGDARANPLLFQPEVLLIFERLENDRFNLKRVWPGGFDRELRGLAAIRQVPWS